MKTPIQPVHWELQNKKYIGLLKHKRAAAIDFLTYEASDEDARKILISAVQATTGDAHSYTTWDSPDLSIGSDENEKGRL